MLGMSSNNVISARVSNEVLAMIDQLAASRDRSRSWIVSKLVEGAAAKQIEMDDFIQVGIDDIEAGRTIAHEDLVEEILNRRKQRAAA
jgi:predicted transcriptional regulator